MNEVQRESFDPKGVIPACLMPFDEALQIDESAYRRHLADLAGVEGISAITLNGHAAEVHALSLDEQIRSMEIAKQELGDTVPLVVGIHRSHSLEAAELAALAESIGIDALLVFPNDATAIGGQRKNQCAHAHLSSIVEATRLPIILFQYPMASGLGYPLETLLELCREFTQISAIKDWCNDPVLHEKHVRGLHALERPVGVLSTHSAWMLSSLVIGCDGLLSGAGSVVASLQVALFRAIQVDDLTAARDIYERLYPVTDAFYADPLLDMHNRMKETLVLLGCWHSARVRPPLTKLGSPEIERLRLAIQKAQLSGDQLYQSVGVG
ncbi:dihydrodipicolinate synthase family protein [Rubripirellula sp.]|nr:dihydrodipicolinate synthase family protein [Rubripirellula sp.]MDB4338901.1 dihydrodipicolinate synthase family protein [Rubripirellula sp.]